LLDQVSFEFLKRLAQGGKMRVFAQLPGDLADGLRCDCAIVAADASLRLFGQTARQFECDLLGLGRSMAVASEEQRIDGECLSRRRVDSPDIHPVVSQFR
jgi:hypothetical protein